MRSVIIVMTTVICCVVAIISVLTIGSYTLQKNELENAMDIALEQTVRNCLEEGIVNADEIASTAVISFKNHIKSKRGTLVLSVLYADENIVDLYASFTYTQYNGSSKVITTRKTVVRDWEEDEEDFIIRQISKRYLNEAPERGGLKENSVWRRDDTFKNTLKNVLDNKQKADGTWEKTPQKTETIKLEAAEP